MNEVATEKLTIVGVGSSAGGLEAIRELVATLPVNVPVSYVVVQHMSPHHKSLMTELVARQTHLLVENVEDGIRPQANVVYITPPKTDVIFADGKLRLVDPSDHPANPKPSVDRFLLSLAEAHGENSMAIILSGTGSDGAYGVQAIREAGGITIAQDAESAKYDGMPQSAVQTGCVDLILRPVEIGTHLQKILTSPRDFKEFRKGSLKEAPLSDLLHILLARTRVDFRDYKQTTIGRRIERRMVALGIETQEEYTQFCRNNPHAVDALFKDLLISVTRFFRDKEAFQQLEELLPQMIEDHGDGPLRVWIAGCATGEEAYSIAMLLSEALGGPKVALKSQVQIFATDIDKNALKVARNGIYGIAALNDIPKELADKYLIHVNDGVRVVENLRNAVLFSDHNVCQDPPFQKVDLICCRNLLIYFGNNLQQKVMSRFHYSMNPDGMMFLGTAESVAGSEELFVHQRGTAHVFRKRVLNKSRALTYNMPNLGNMTSKAAAKNVVDHGPSTDRQLFEALAQSLGKNSLLVTDDYSIVRVYGSISPFIEMNSSSSLKMHLDLLRSPLREEARSLITIALKNGKHRAGVRHLLTETDQEEVRLDVYPIIAKDINERAALVVFSPIKVDRAHISRSVSEIEGDSVASERILTLENEVATTREALQQTIEELETSNEELQSLNEELQSTNEELQATNEELETSNEELQSTNEELITVNEELQVTASELSGRTGELTSVLQSTPLAIIVTDSALQITQATVAASELFHIKRPITRPHISQCELPDGYPSLAPICIEALKLGQTVAQQVTSLGKRVLISCSPYFDSQGQILGLTMVVVTTDFPALAREMDMILDSPHFLIMHRNRDGEILRISESSAQTLGLSRSDAIGRNIKDLVGDSAGQQLINEDRAFLESGKDISVSEFRLNAQDPAAAKRLSLTRIPFTQNDGQTPSVYSFAYDLTEIMNAKDEANELADRLKFLQEMANVGYWQIDLRTNAMTWSSEVFKIHGMEPREHAPDIDEGLTYYHPDDIEPIQTMLAKVIEDGGEFQFIKRLIRADKTVVRVESHGVSVKDASGEVIKLAGIFREAHHSSDLPELPTPS
ncbi:MULTISPECIES: chemotaxis protein CheB [unclassified Marinovum]